ncbi:MAG: hypothetical protein JWR62_877 [Modestobacter sp.]|jgi:hypothetical protein|nr:hypothetical protein [Modestobacter sp.]HEV7870132.1 hypothetical protein [Modestobacter sp.]
MTVTDPDVPDPLNDPRTLQADPGAVAEGEDLASTEDDPTSTGEDELADDGAAGGTTGDAPADGTGALLPGDPMAPGDAAPGDLTGGDVTGGVAGG